MDSKGEFELFFQNVPSKITCHSFRKVIDARLSKHSNAKFSIIDQLECDLQDKTNRKVVIKLRDEQAFNTLALYYYLIVDSYLLRLNQSSNQQPENKEKKTTLKPIRLDPNEFPLKLMQNDPSVWKEFLNLIHQEFNSTYTIENKQIECESNNRVSQSTLVIHSRVYHSSDSNNNKHDEEKSQLQAFRNSLGAFRTKHFMRQEVQKTNMPQSWTSVTRLLSEFESRQLVLIVSQNPLSIEFYGLKNSVQAASQQIAELVDHHLGEELTKRELNKSLSTWQIDYLKLYESDLMLANSLTLKLTNSRVFVYGPSCQVDKSMASIEKFVDSLRQDELDIEPRLLAYFSMETNLRKLHEIVVKNNNVSVILSTNGLTVFVVYAHESQKSRCVELVERVFACHVHMLSDEERASLARVSKRFQESMIAELKLTVQELRETLVIENNGDTLVFIGESRLVHRCSQFFKKFFQDHQEITKHLTDEYNDFETSRFLQLVKADEIERMNREAEREVGIYPVCELIGRKDEPPRVVLNCFRSRIDEYKARVDAMVVSKITEYYTVPVEALNLANLFATKISEGNARIEIETRCLIIPMTFDSNDDTQPSTSSTTTTNNNNNNNKKQKITNSAAKHQLTRLVTDNNGKIFCCIDSPSSKRCELDVVANLDDAVDVVNDMCLHLLECMDDSSAHASELVCRVIDFMQKCQRHEHNDDDDVVNVSRAVSVGIVFYDELYSAKFELLARSVLTTVVDNLGQSGGGFSKITFVSSSRSDLVTQLLLDMMLDMNQKAENDASREPVQSHVTQPLRKQTVRFLSVELNIYQGDITQAQTEAVINPTNKDLDQEGQVTTALIRIDPSLSNEMVKLKTSFKRVATMATSSFNFHTICHVDVGKPPLKDCILEALHHLNNSNCQSVTLPLVGSGHSNTNPVDSCREIKNAVNEFATSITNLELTRIDVCLHKPEHYDEFWRQINDQHRTGSLVGSHNDSLRPTQKVTNLVNKRSYDETDMISFKLVSDQQDRIDRCKKMICELVNGEIESQEYSDDYLDPSNGEITSRIDHLCVENNLTFEWNFDQHKIRLSGAHRNVAQVQVQIGRIIAEWAKSKQCELIAQRVQWQMLNNHDEWRPLNLFLNTQIEMKHSSCVAQQTKSAGNAAAKIRLLDEKGEYFEADVVNMTLVYENEPRKSYKLQRTDIQADIKYPLVWTSKIGFELVTLNPNSQEYKQTLQCYLDNSLSPNSVISIQRVENRFLYTQYKSLQEYYVRKYGADKLNEKRLFHGTGSDCLDSIWKAGFNRSYAGKNATLFGQGVYFSTVSSYSHDFTDISRLRKNVGHMFLAKVMVGNYQLGNSKMKYTPPNVDSTVNDMKNPFIFVIYKDAQAYPEYLLTYT